MDLGECEIRFPTKSNLEKLTKANDSFRKVVYTGVFVQIVLYSLKPEEDIGVEQHRADQFVRVESGSMRVTIGGVSQIYDEDEWFVVPSGAEHNIENLSDVPCKFYMNYSPPQHPPFLEQRTKPTGGT